MPRPSHPRRIAGSRLLADVAVFAAAAFPFTHPGGLQQYLHFTLGAF